MKNEKRLTAKQLEIAKYFANDHDIPAIATKTGKFYKNIEKLVARAKDKLGVRTAQGLVAEAHRHRCINLDERKKG